MRRLWRVCLVRLRILRNCWKIRKLIVRLIVCLGIEFLRKLWLTFFRKLLINLMIISSMWNLRSNSRMNSIWSNLVWCRLIKITKIHIVWCNLLTCSRKFMLSMKKVVWLVSLVWYYRSWIKINFMKSTWMIKIRVTMNLFLIRVSLSMVVRN